MRGTEKREGKEGEGGREITFSFPFLKINIKYIYHNLILKEHLMSKWEMRAC